MSEEIFNPFHSEEVSPPYSAHWEAKRRVGAAIRQLTEVLITSTPPTADLHDIAERLELTAKNFSGFERLYGRNALANHGGHGGFGELVHETNPLSGLSNPLAPPLNTWIDKDRAYGRVTMGWAYEGPPGCVHGGYVAALFDEFMGIAQVLGKQPGMTGTLQVRYERPTPLNRELRLEAWLVEVEGRKTRIHAEMSADDQVTARCEALFIRPKHGLSGPTGEPGSAG